MGAGSASVRPGGKRRLLIVVAVVAAVFAVLVVIAQLIPQSPVGGAGTTPTPTATESPEAEAAPELAIVQRAEGDPMAIGAVDAPVVLVFWTDMRCPFCAVFSRETEQTLIDEYVATGKVRIEMHTVAFFGDESAAAAVAAVAAGEQGMYFEYLKTVYAAAPEGARADLPRDALIGFAEQAGIPDIARFTADLDRPDLNQRVQQATSTAQQLGVSSVPFFVAGNQAISGAQPVEVFREFLDDALARAG